ncbi:MAG: hypothetical protein LBH37_04475 [Oscillospiraceae bacterium]|jgi:hypothetical protein|nr:hypothetical protein [Oscillospiraceae bacterium]
MTNNFKFLTEQRAEKVEEMRKLVDTAKSEKRALTEEQVTLFEELKKTNRKH